MDNLSNLEERLKKLILETGDETALDSYANLKSARNQQNYYDYLRIFALCRALGATDLYDIGCGHSRQAFLLSKSLDIYYTGIDCNYDFRDLNALFAELNANIKFQQAEYPFKITPAENNIAISHYALGALGTMGKGEDAIKNAAKALSTDFERILISINQECLSTWETELAGFALRTVGYDVEDGKTERSIPTVLGTKFPEEFAALDEMEYNYYNNRFMIEFIAL